MKKIALTVCVLCLAFGIGNATAQQQATPHYDVINQTADITIDGKTDEKVWQDIGAIDGEFHYPWLDIAAPRTVFKAFHDSNNFYFRFVVKDKDIVVDKTWKNKSTVDNEDRVELFFAPAPIDKTWKSGLPTYYAIEIDPMGRVHDYSTVYYRHLDSSWAMKGLKTAATIQEDGYVVEGSIPLQTLRDLELIDSHNIMRTGVYRAEFSRIGKDIDMRWISWVDPKTENPDYHVDSSFGEFRFIK